MCYLRVGSYYQWLWRLLLISSTIHVLYTMQSKHLQDILPLFFRRKTLYGSLSSRLLATGISIMSGCLRNAHLNLVFHVDGSGCSPGLYLPVCSAHMRNSTASWSRLKSGFPACFHVTRNFVFSLSSQCSPGTSPLSTFWMSQGNIFSLSERLMVLLACDKQPMYFSSVVNTSEATTLFREEWLIYADRILHVVHLFPLLRRMGIPLIGGIRHLIGRLLCGISGSNVSGCYGLN